MFPALFPALDAYDVEYLRQVPLACIVHDLRRFVATEHVVEPGLGATAMAKGRIEDVAALVNKNALGKVFRGIFNFQTVDRRFALFASITSETCCKRSLWRAYKT
jgi:hypothetical protein